MPWFLPNPKTWRLPKTDSWTPELFRLKKHRSSVGVEPRARAKIEWLDRSARERKFFCKNFFSPIYTFLALLYFPRQNLAEFCRLRQIPAENLPGYMPDSAETCQSAGILPEALYQALQTLPDCPISTSCATYAESMLDFAIKKTITVIFL